MNRQFYLVSLFLYYLLLNTHVSAQEKTYLSVEFGISPVHLKSGSFQDNDPGGIFVITYGYLSDIRSDFNYSGKLILNLPGGINPYLSFNVMNLYENDLFNPESELLDNLYGAYLKDIISKINISTEDISLSGFGVGVRYDKLPGYKNILPFIQAEIDFYNFSTKFYQSLEVSPSGYPDIAIMNGHGQMQT
ncbi:hypothetical protein ACFL6G_02510, partial [candidate division KSB1 bacterium]